MMMNLMNRKGFTLVEIMIVVAIIALLAAIAIPNLLRARLNANEAAAISAVKTLVAAEISWHSVNGSYTNDILNDLSGATPPYIDSVLGSGTKQGYGFAVTNADAYGFDVNAAPAEVGKTGNRYFFANEEGVIKQATSAAGPWTAIQ